MLRSIDDLRAEVAALRVVNGQVLEPDQPDDSTKGICQAETLLDWLKERLDLTSTLHPPSHLLASIPDFMVHPTPESLGRRDIFRPM